jgi:hypothetical protein
MRLKPFTVHQKWVIGLMIFGLILSVFSPLNNSQNLKYTNFIPSHLSLSSLDSQTLFLTEQQPNYRAFLAKPTLLLIFKSKLLRWIGDYKATYPDFTDTLNLYTAMMVIVLFIMFYRLSKTSLQEPDPPMITSDY